MNTVRKLGRLRSHPLVVFFLVGAVLFLIESLRRTDAPAPIVISEERIAGLERNLAKRFGRPPSQDEINAEIQYYLDEEVLYRRALELDLHRSDPVVRQRLAQSMGFILENEADFETPSDDELKTLFDERRQKTDRARIDFRHIFFSADRRGVDAKDDAQAALASLADGAEEGSLGDPFLTGRHFRAQSLVSISRQFGEQFSGKLAGAEPGHWAGPFASAYGQHLVFTEGWIFPQQAEFSAVREELSDDWRAKRRNSIRQEAIRELRRDYAVELTPQE